MNKAFLCTAILCLFIGPVSASELDLNYDFRFRYEYTDDGSKADTRNRNRIRTRLGAKYSPSEKLDLFIRFATAEENTTSGNQTLGTDFTASDIGMDQLYLKYNLSDNANLLFGKMKNPFFKPNKSELIFDGDYNPKGLAFNLSFGDVFSNIGHIKFDANPSKSIDLNSLQVGLSKNINDSTKAKISFAIYDFDKVREFNPNQITWNGKNFGNSTDVNGNYLYDFSLRNLSLEIKTEMMSLPTSFFQDMVIYSVADQNDSVFLSCLSLLISEKWKFTYLYKDIESDSTFGALTHSDFGGGGAGHKGHQFNFSYPVTKRLSVDLVWFDNKKKMTFDYNKLFLDFKYKL